MRLIHDYFIVKVSGSLYSLNNEVVSIKEIPGFDYRGFYF
jgi:hypothetical protein